MIRATSFPILLLIALYERQSKRHGSSGIYDTMAAAADKIYDALPRPLKRLTLFVGLAGADADIDAIFEIKDILDIALDTHDYDRIPLSGHHDSSPASPRRVNSVLNRETEVAQTFTSPLAQIFQPLVVDDDVREDAAPESSHLGIPDGVSYGPASRRRHSVMQRSPAADSATNIAYRFPSMSSHHGHQEGQMSSSPGVDPSQSELETAEEVQREESSAGGMIQWVKRLQNLEEGQKRIEDLLIQLSKGKI